MTVASSGRMSKSNTQQRLFSCLPQVSLCLVSQCTFSSSSRPMSSSCVSPLTTVTSTVWRWGGGGKEGCRRSSMS
jgi:hypothetical protein